MHIIKLSVAFASLLIACVTTQAQTTKPVPMILVEASFPGANALDVAENVAAPIEQEVNGVANLLQLESRSNNDGTYLLAVKFKPGTDLDKAQVLVQNRVAVAEARLPDEVKRQGITVRKLSPVLMLVNLSAPTGRYDMLYLTNYASLQLKDDLLRLPGVGVIKLYGTRSQDMRVYLDPAKLKALNLTPAEVVDALRQQNRQVAPGRIGQPPVPRGQEFQYPLGTLGRLTELGEFGDIVIKTDGKDKVVRLKDVGRLELGAQVWDANARFNSKPGAVLAVYPIGGADAKKVSKAVVDKLAQQRAKLPEGLKLDVVADFSANEADYLLLDVELPPGASAQRIDETLQACAKLLRDVKEVKDIVELGQNPFDIIRNQACILVRLEPANKRKASREEIVRAIRKKLEEIQAASIRLRDLSRRDGFRYPIDFGVSGPEPAKTRELAETFAARLRQTKKLTDVGIDPASQLQPHFHMDIDRAKAGNLGVGLAELYDTLGVYFGSAYANDFNKFGRTWSVIVSADAKAGYRAEELKRLHVRNKEGKMVPLDGLVEMRESGGPKAVHRVDMWPVIAVSANPTAATLKQARAVCEAEFAAACKELRLPATYRLHWLNAPR